MRFGLSSVCPRSFGSPFIGPHRRFFLLFFHVFLSSCLLILILSFSCAYYRPDLSLHTYTHAYSTYIEVQVAQVRYNEVWFIGCPSSLGSSSTATTHTHTFVCLVLFIFICPFCVHMCLVSFPGRMEATHAPLRGGVCVCVCVCNPWNQREPLGLEQGATEAPEERWPTKTSSGVRANVPANCLPVVLAVVCFHGGSCGSVTNRYSRFVF